MVFLYTLNEIFYYPLYQYYIISTMSNIQDEKLYETEIEIKQYFKQYPHLANSLSKMNIVHPTYLQNQVLAINSQIQNLVICAPENYGKKMAAILYTLKKFVNVEKGTLLVLMHSKEISFEVQHIFKSLTQLTCINTYVQKQIQKLPQKSILISSPLQAENLNKESKDSVQYILVLEFDYHISFGYYDSLVRLFDTIKCIYILTSTSNCKQIASFKQIYLKKTLNVVIEEQPEEMETEKIDTKINHFYSVGESIIKNINLYMILKFRLVHPKILIICDSVKEVYKQFIFLERCKITNLGIYNVHDPISIRFYSLSLWLTGSVEILITTKELFNDIDSGIFKESSMRLYKKPNIQLKNLATIITLNVDFLREEFNILFQYFEGKALVINLIDNVEHERDALQELINFEKINYETVKIKDFPISRTEIEAFKYRVSDVYQNIGHKRVDWMMEYDMKKKIVKSKDLKTYFETNPAEKQLLLKKINELRAKINYGRVELTEEVPEYLIPEFLKTAYLQKLKQQEKKDMKNPDKKQTIQTKIKKAIYSIDPQNENPETTDVSRLKVISGRKRWKLMHGFKLKKRNLRNEKKGIFTA